MSATTFWHLEHALARGCFRARHRERQLYVDTGRPRRKQALLVQMVVREKL